MAELIFKKAYSNRITFFKRLIIFDKKINILLKKISKFLLVLLIVVFVLGYFFMKKAEPIYKGTLVLDTLVEEVTVFYDAIGVPHINATNDQDAYVAFGYVHAQDRLWQMELMRRIAAGRLSEIFGKDLVRVDKFMSGLGIEEATKKTLVSLDKTTPSYKLAMAYLNGINQFIEKGATPVEFHLLGIEKEKYTLNDIYNVFGFMSFSFAVAHKTDPLLTEIKDKLGDEYLKELGIPISHVTLMENTKKEPLEVAFSEAMNEIMEQLPVPSFIGSNSWVLGPEKTKNGKVIFVNDPHINYSQPSIWYQSHIKTPNHEIYGFNLALTPFPLLGHNRNKAYGLTMLENDDVDFYIEEENPENSLEYKTPKGYVAYDLIDKKIKIKGEKDTVYQIKVSKHGPVMNNLIDHLDSERPIAMQWIYTKLPNKLLIASYEMSYANSLKAFKKAVSQIHAPGLNIMYGDSEDNIARFGSAKLYQYRDSINTKLYLNGASGKDEIIKYLDFEENPMAINPDEGYVYSANNQPDSIAGVLYPGYYLPQDRAKRIVEIIKTKSNYTKEDAASMLLDVKSSTVTDVISNISQSINIKDLNSQEKEVIKTLTDWDGNYYKENIAPTIYNRFLYEFLTNTFKDEMGKGFHVFMDGTHLQKKIIAVQMEKQESIWWDDISTEDKKESKEEILTRSFKNTVTFLNNQLGVDIHNWKWSKVASLEHEHAIGKGGEVLRKVFNVGPFEINGGNEVINNHIYTIDSTGYYKIKGGPSSRRVIDFSDIENSIGIIPTGQSGNRFSAYYKDQTQKYLKGDFVKMKLNQKEIEQSENKLVFKPNH